jgi:putrescine transport system permease protein
MKAPLWLQPRHWIPSGKRLLISIPYGWLLLFLLVPFGFVLKISLAMAEIALPPFTELWQWDGSALRVTLQLGNYQFLLSDPLYLLAYLNSVKIAAISTFLCLLLGYPMAYAIARMPPNSRNIWLLAIILPSWTSFLIRIYAWIGILKNNGLLNNLLLWLGVLEEPLQLLHTEFAVYLGIVYAYLPFMVLPLYTNLVKLDTTLLEAAADLGARPWKVFVRVTLPLSRSGIIAGSLLVFIPAVGEFVIPELLGGPGTLMIGKVLWQEFFNNRDWPIASAVAMVMLGFLLIPITFFHRAQFRQLQDP